MFKWGRGQTPPPPLKSFGKVFVLVHTPYLSLCYNRQVSEPGRASAASPQSGMYIFIGSYVAATDRLTAELYLVTGATPLSHLLPIVNLMSIQRSGWPAHRQHYAGALAEVATHPKCCPGPPECFSRRSLRSLPVH